MSKEEHVTIDISKNAALVLEELSEISGLPPERLVDEAVILYWKQTAHYYRAIKENAENENKNNDYGASV